MERESKPRPRARWPQACGFVAPSWPPAAASNGIVTYVGRVVPAIREAGVDPYVLAWGAPATNDGVVALNPEGPGRHRLARLADRAAWLLLGHRNLHRAEAACLSRAIRSLQRDSGLELIEIEDSHGLARLIAPRVSLPVVVRLHGPWFHVGPSLNAMQDEVFQRRVRNEGRAIALAAGVCAPSSDVLDRTRSFYGLELADAWVCPSPMPLAPETERWSLEGCDRRRILFVGRFDWCKGGDVIIDAFAEAARRRPDIALTLVGPDPGLIDASGRRWAMREYLEEHVPDRARRSVSCLGFQPPEAIAGLRRKALVTVVCSRYENFPNTALEAMAAACPLVASKVGGIPEMVQDGRNGIHVRPGDPAALANALISLLDDPIRAAALGAQAARDCAARYDPGVVARATLDRYAEVIARQSRHRGQAGGSEPVPSP